MPTHEVLMLLILASQVALLRIVGPGSLCLAAGTARGQVKLINSRHSVAGQS